MTEGKSIFCDCLYFSANSLARNLTRLAEESFAPTGLAPSHAFALMAINRVPGVSPSEVAKEMHMTPSTITRFLDKLEKKGLIQRISEGKSSRLHPTQKGAALNDDLEKAWRHLLSEYNAVLGEKAAAGLSGVVYDASELLKE